MISNDWQARIHFLTECPSLDKGLIECLDAWRLSVPKPRLIVVDVFQRVRPISRPGSNSFEADYAALAGLQRWATWHGIAVLLLHHTRKGGADDPLEALSGSNGLSACADTTLLLDKDGNSCSLYVRGRDVEEKHTAILFNDAFW